MIECCPCARVSHLGCARNDVIALVERLPVRVGVLLAGSLGLATLFKKYKFEGGEKRCYFFQEIKKSFPKQLGNVH